IHRDLKPENIFVVRDPEVTGGERTKVLDFGIAKLAGNIGRQHRTNTAVVMGTPRYMSPEQCRGGGTPVDQRSDIYSLGCVLYTLVVGHPPFDTMATGVLIMQHMSDPPPRPSKCAPNVPAELDELLLRCLAKEPADRPGTGTELAVAIDALLALPAVTNAPPPVHVAPSIAPSATTLDQLPTYVTPASLIDAVRGRRRRRRRIAFAMGAVAAAAVAVTLLRGGHEPAAASVVAPSPPSSPIIAPAPTPRPLDPRPDDARAELRAMLAAFAHWSETHAAAICPTAAELGAARDPWQHPYAVTCTDQPADQVVGVRSAGPDGAMETDDDIVSWTLEDALKLARGPRWKPVIAPAATPLPPPPRRGQLGSQPPSKRPPPATLDKDSTLDLDGDGIPDRRK
ncbi:MAG: serine/threonine protein kinase, partial [bacterium]